MGNDGEAEDRWTVLDAQDISDEGIRALYEASDPHAWLGAARDYRALPVADAAARRGREAVRLALNAASMTTVDRLIAAARDTRDDPARHALALALRPAIMRAALLAAAPGWHITPNTGAVSRFYDADGNDITDRGGEGATFVRLVHVDLDVYMWGADIIRPPAEGYFADGGTDNPREAIRLVLAQPLPT